MQNNTDNMQLYKITIRNKPYSGIISSYIETIKLWEELGGIRKTGTLNIVYGTPEILTEFILYYDNPDYTVKIKKIL
jgi:hypothetical protein